MRAERRLALPAGIFIEIRMPGLPPSRSSPRSVSAIETAGRNGRSTQPRTANGLKEVEEAPLAERSAAVILVGAQEVGLRMKFGRSRSRPIA